jgi:hypothetical protein
VIELPVTVFEQIEFCQSHPVLGSTGYLMVRDPRTAIAKDSVALKPLDNNAIKQQWLAAVGMGGLALTAGLPVYQQFYSMFKRHSNGAKPLKDTTLDGGFFRLSKGMSRVDTPISDETRFSFWLAFGINPTEQRCLEDYYLNYEMEDGDYRCRFNYLPL